MKNYEIKRMAVLIDPMAECIGCGTNEIIAHLKGNCLNEDDANDIQKEITEMEE